MSALERAIKFMRHGLGRPKHADALKQNYNMLVDLQSANEAAITLELFIATYTNNPIARRVINDITLDVSKAGFAFECGAPEGKEVELAKQFERLYKSSLQMLLKIQAVCGSALIVFERPEGFHAGFMLKIYKPGREKDPIFGDGTFTKLEGEEGFEVCEKGGEVRKVSGPQALLYRGAGVFNDDLLNSMLYPVIKNVINHDSYLQMELKTAKRGTLTRVCVNRERLMARLFPYFSKPSIAEFNDAPDGLKEAAKSNHEKLNNAANEGAKAYAAAAGSSKVGDVMVVDDCFDVASQEVIKIDFARQTAKEEEMIAIGFGIPITVFLGKHNGNFGSGGSGSDNSYSQMYRSKIFAEQEVFKPFLAKVLRVYFALNGISSPADFDLRMKPPYPETDLERVQRKRAEVELEHAQLNAFNTGLESVGVDPLKLAERLGIVDIMNEAELEEHGGNAAMEHAPEEL